MASIKVVDYGCGGIEFSVEHPHWGGEPELPGRMLYSSDGDVGSNRLGIAVAPSGLTTTPPQQASIELSTFSNILSGTFSNKLKSSGRPGIVHNSFQLTIPTQFPFSSSTSHQFTPRNPATFHNNGTYPQDHVRHPHRGDGRGGSAQVEDRPGRARAWRGRDPRAQRVCRRELHRHVKTYYLYLSTLHPMKPPSSPYLPRTTCTNATTAHSYFRTGLYKSPLPLITGKEAAGTIIAVHPSVQASDPALQAGTRVAYVADHAYAEFTAVGAERAAAIPEGLDTQTAAASLLQGLTALTFVREAAGLAQPHAAGHRQLGVSEGPWALVHAAAGGTGSMLVQMLAAHGVRVIGTGGGEEKCVLAKANGAQWVVDSKREDVVARVKEITNGKGVDVIFDGVGKATFDGDLEMIARKGTLAVFGNAVSDVGLRTLRVVMLMLSIVWSGSSRRRSETGRQEHQAHATSAVFLHCDQGGEGCLHQGAI